MSKLIFKSKKAKVYEERIPVTHQASEVIYFVDDCSGKNIGSTQSRDKAIALATAAT